MSLVQHVTSIEGVDREPLPLDIPSNWTGSVGYGTIDAGHILRHVPSHQRSLRRIRSYDAIANPEETSHAISPTGGVTQYRVSTARRVGKSLDFIYRSVKYI